MNQEMMKFYRENKVNPFASCLPMVAQFPVFISLYYMLRIDLRHDICPEINGPGTPNSRSRSRAGRRGESSFLFIPDLTDKATGTTLIILIVLYVGSQLFSTLLMSTTTDQTQRMIFLALPFVFVTFVIQFPAGLLVYWITTNLWTIVQQAIIKKRLGPLRPPPAGGRSRRRACSEAAAAARGSRPKPRRRRPKAPARAKARPAKSAAASRRAARRARRRRHRARRRSVRGDGDERVRAIASRDLLEHVSDALALEADGRRSSEEGRSIRGDARGRRPRAVHRPPRPDDRRRPAPRLQDRDARPAAVRRRCAWSSTPPATASAASRRCSARPTRPRRTPCAPAARSRWTR